MLITKMAECSVRLMRIQNRESAMFDLASSEAGHPEESIKSLDNSSDKLIQEVCDAYSENWKLDPGSFVKKSIIMDEIDYQNLDDVTGWAYVEDNMPTATDYIIKKCTNESLNLYDFISRETDQSKNIGIRLIIEGEDSSDENMSLSIEEIVKGAQNISPYSLKKYLDQFAHGLIEDLQAQLILRGLDERTQQIKDAAMPDPKKLDLIQRYRTTDERQFSKTLKELIRLLQMRKNI